MNTPPEVLLGVCSNVLPDVSAWVKGVESVVAVDHSEYPRGVDGPLSRAIETEGTKCIKDEVDSSSEFLLGLVPILRLHQIEDALFHNSLLGCSRPNDLNMDFALRVPAPELRGRKFE